MQIDVTFRQMNSSNALRSYAADKVGRLRKLLDGPIGARVTLSLDGFQNVADVTIQAKGSTLTARESSNVDMYAAVDVVVDKLAAQARRHKERLRSHRAAPTAEVAVPIDLEPEAPGAS